MIQIFRKSIQNLSDPKDEAQEHLGSVPFENPSIQKAIMNFVSYKYSSLDQTQWQNMYDLSKMFLHYINHWKLETPSIKRRNSPEEEFSTYKMNYTRLINLFKLKK